MANTPHLFRRANWLYTSSDGEYSASNRDGVWRLETRAGEKIAEGTSYQSLLPLFRDWWDSHGEDKREKEWGRF